MSLWQGIEPLKQRFNTFCNWLYLFSRKKAFMYVALHHHKRTPRWDTELNLFKISLDYSVNVNRKRKNICEWHKNWYTEPKLRTTLMPEGLLNIFFFFFGKRKWEDGMIPSKLPFYKLTLSLATFNADMRLKL